MFSSIKKIHFVGIGGIGMSGIAEILINRGFEVTGSDITSSENTLHLEKLGATIYPNHKEENIINAEVVVYSSAVAIDNNPETQAAKRKLIPVIRRAEMLAEVARLNYCLAVAGTHGKTTTTSILALVLLKAGIDPTVIVGGRLKDLGGTNARLGKGEWTIVEADEYDRSFLQLSPAIAVLNNIEAEHLDIYINYNNIKSAFTQFANKVPFYGFVAAGIDCAGVRAILPNINKKIITFGLLSSADYYAQNIIYSGFSSTFDVYEHNKFLGKMKVNVPGEHNIKNALAAVLVARQFGISFETIANVIAEFRGVFRRFEIKGEINGAIIVDDYAHHPTEITATLKGTKNYEGKRVIAIFQPHTYTRTADFHEEFAQALSAADLVFVTDVYPARETPIPGVTGELIVSTANNIINNSKISNKIANKNKMHYIADKNNVPAEILKILQPNDIVITIGAGDIWKITDDILSSC